MEVAIASDHAGFELKELLRKYLLDKGYNIIDLGTGSTESVDYPEYGEKLAREVRNGEIFGIAVCGSGNGIAMACNKVRGIRAALCYNQETAQLARLHNDANIVCIGSRLTDAEVAKTIVDTFLETEFEGGRHQRRVDKIKAIED